MTPGSVPAFATRLREAIDATGSLLCLGLDPDGMEDAAAAERFCFGALEGALPHVCAVKPNLAFFEQLGTAGRRLLEQVRARIPAGCLVILDAKRGDVGTSAAAYARALLDGLDADAVTVNPLMGQDAVRPFLDRPGRGAFILTRTSNPGAADLLDQPLATGEMVYERIVDLTLTWDPGGAAGFVVGATDPGAVTRVRRRAPHAPLLIPGVGAQGGHLEASVAAGLDPEGRGLVIAVSRGITGAIEGPGTAAAALRTRINAIRPCVSRTDRSSGG